MTPDHEHITPENVEEQIHHALQTRDQRNSPASAETHLIRELDRLYRSEEGIMVRTWARLREQHPEVGNLHHTTSSLPSRVLPFPQRPTRAKTANKGWKQRASLLLAVAVSLLLIGASFLLFHQSQGISPAHQSVPVTGPLQLFDRHGKLFYQTDGKKTFVIGDNQHTFVFAQYVVEQLAQDLQVEQAKLTNMGLRVTTTLDLDVQNKAYADAQQQILKVKDTKHITDSAVVVLDYHTGSIRALIGSLNERQHIGYNVVIRDGRQLGDVYKPFVYATAFEQGISPGNIVNDTRTTFPPDGYTPQNYDGQFHGLMSYRTALQNRYNIPAIKLLTRTGIAPTVKKVEALGVPSSLAPSQYGYAIAIGSTNASVLDATVAYGTMANQGVHIAPNAIENVTDRSGRTLFQMMVRGTSALSPAAAFMITDVLSDSRAGVSSLGACTPMVLYSTSQAQCLTGNLGTVRPAAVMCSLNDVQRDLWAIGYTSDYVVGVWAGNADLSTVMNATPQDGVAQIWHDTMTYAEGNAPIQQFPGPPATVVKKTVSEQGLTTTDWHLK